MAADEVPQLLVVLLLAQRVLLCCVGELRTRGVCGGCGNRWRAGEGATRAVLASLRYDTRGSLQGIFISELFCMKLAPIPTLHSG